MTKHGRGLICLALTEKRVEQLHLPMMTQNNLSPHQTAFTNSIEAATGVTTGISAHDRACTIAAAIADDAKAGDIISPGHVFPLKAQENGVLTRPGHTEAGVDLARLAQLKPAAVICEIMNEDGSMARVPELEKLAEKFQLTFVTVADLIYYREYHECLVKEVANAKLPTQYDETFNIKIFRNLIDQKEHVVLLSENFDPEKTNLVRLHSSCMTGDVFGSMLCDCGEQLHIALKQLKKEGGALIYLSQEGRGIGLGNKIKAYELQQQGLDTVQANHHLGFADDLRSYSIAAQIIKYLGLQKIKLLTNNPAKQSDLENYGVTIEKRVPLNTKPNQYNYRYLKTKRDKFGHYLDL